MPAAGPAALTRSMSLSLWSEAAAWLRWKQSAALKYILSFEVVFEFGLFFLFQESGSELRFAVAAQ